jgi:tRNA(Ile)-lysidine synthase
MPTRKRIDWPAVAAAFAARIPQSDLHPAALHRAQAEGLRELRQGARPSRWALAFSGGADSLALLLILWAEGPGRWGRDFVVLHFNHRLRGRAADRDEKFCRAVCAALGVTFVAGRWLRGGGVLARSGARKRAAGGPRVSEAEARTARFEFFRREMSRRKLRLLWLAHQQDDIAESLLMRLARGSGPGGLAAPRPVQAMGEGRLHLRPLLTLKKAHLLMALKKAGAVWCEDASNEGDDYFRNRIRSRVLPAWAKAAGRDALAGAALSRELLEEDDAALEAWLDELNPLDQRGRLDLGRLAGKPRALARRALHRWLLAVRPETDLSRQGFNQLLGLVQRGQDTRFSLGAKGFAVIRRGGLVWQKG